ncbi:glutamine-hydrolyzing carbamoyl-phosphate synthase small subunit [Candidatus Sumerlaeota bacterium]|nr:glutamine-hydrolyzing carbamoyl-phosphate synthase small subunit [Candidatus Sumerlaeota bacterium]
MRLSAPQPALLALEDGHVQRGHAVGAPGTVFGEMVFNTAMTGYQEILTDPSYFRQIITFCYPLIGNYGVVDADDESRRVFASGLVVREMSPLANSARMEGDLPTWLIKRGVVGIGGVDTRELVLHIREQGAMRGAVSTEITDPDELVDRVRASESLVGIDSITPVTIKAPMVVEPPEGTSNPVRLAALDCGMKRSIGRLLAREGFHVTILPATTPPQEILDGPYDALFLSNGPGDPAGVPWLVENLKQLVPKMPTTGICFGHQMLGLALGGTTSKLKFGHRGANHPVKDLRTGEIQITSQNHGFVVDLDSLGGDVEPTHLNLNDHTNEGLRHRELPILSVQYHPEAAPGPHDAAPLFREFHELCRQALG